MVSSLPTRRQRNTPAPLYLILMAVQPACDSLCFTIPGTMRRDA